MKLLRSLPVRTLLVSALISFSSLTSWAQTANAPERVTQAVDMQNRVTLRGNTHPLARPEYDQGVAPDSLPMERMLLVLQRSTEQEATLRKLLDEQQVKSSPNYHMWLTPEQFGQQFGPVDTDVQAVTDWLGSQGFQVSRVAAGRTVIEFSGTAGAVRQAFHTEIHKFVVNGEEHWANASDPQIPAALTPVVAGFASLNNFPRKPMVHRLGTFSRSKATGKVQPLFTFSPEPNGYLFAVGPADFATIYNVAPLWTAGTDGTGQTIAVVGETNINPQDVADFRSMFGLPANPPNIILNGPDPGINGDETEADLDVQWSGGVAKGATIDFVVSESTETTAGIDLSALYIIDNNLAPVMSESYGACEAELGASGNQFYNTLWEQATSQGITVLMAAGDSGSAGCDSANMGETYAQYGLAVSGLASTPFNVAVGGTDFNVSSSNALTYWSLTNTLPSQSSAKSYIPESTWNDSCAASGSLTGCTPPPNADDLSSGIYLAAGSGGPSSCTNPSGVFPTFTCSGKYSKPSWQSGAGVPNDIARDIPDLSLFAGNGMHYSFYVICEMDANAYEGGSSGSCDLNAPYLDFQGGGGTSASVQAFAGIMALVNQRYGRQGNANYVLYPMAAKSGASCNSSTAPVTNSSCIFYDVTVGNNSVICEGGTPDCSNHIPASGQYGIMVSDGLAAYPTTNGYDLATGLGSVNVANLVNKWTSNFTPSKTTLALSTSPPTNPITLTHGQPINFSVDVSPGSGSGTPTGDVSLIAQAGSSSSNVTGIGPFTLTGGSVSGSTLMLPGGSYNVTAHYAGSGTFAASDSAPGIPVTVGKESSLTEIRLVTLSATGSLVYNVTTAPYGSPYLLRMDVTNRSGQPCVSPTTGSVSYPCPTGALTLSPAPTDTNLPPGTVLGSYVLNSQGYAEDQFIQLAAGTYDFVASYAGDNGYTASTSPVVPITITRTPTTTTFSGLPSLVQGNTEAIVTVAVQTQSSGLAPSCANVRLVVGTTQLWGGDTCDETNGSPSAPASLLTTAYVTLPGGAQQSVTAQYLGDSYYAPSSSAPVTVTVTDFSISSNPASISIPAPGQSATATLTITPLYGFTGTVNLQCTFLTSTSNPGMSCSMTPTSFTFSGSSPATATVTLSTTAPVSSTPSPPQMRVPPSSHAPAGRHWILAMMLCLAILTILAAMRARAAAVLLASALLVTGVWVACGGGGNGSSPYISAPAVGLSTNGLTFSQQTVGTASAPQTLTLSNTGNATLNISNITINGTNSGDFAQTSNCNSSLGAGSSCTISVTFTPSASGPRTASLTLTDNASGSPHSVGLIGTGVAPTVMFSPTTLSFGQQNTGTTSAPQTITLSNTGNAALNISNMAVSGTNSGDFAQTSNCGSGLGGGSSCTISVTFTPSASGTRTASLTITDNASGSPQNVGLTGMGFTPTITFSPSSLSFGQEDVNATTPPRTVTLSNTGSTSVSILGIEIPTYGFAETNNCGSSLAAGANCAINVTFTPMWAGPFSTQLVVIDNAPASPQYCNLTGTGVQPTPPGSYTIQISGQSGPDSHTLSVPVTVQ